MALGTSIEFVVQMKDKFRDLPFSLLTADPVEEGVAEKTPGKKSLFIDAGNALLQKCLELKNGIVLPDEDDATIDSFCDEFGISRQNDSLLLTGDLEQLVKIPAAIVDRVVAEHSQLLCQSPQHGIDKKLSHSVDIVQHNIQRRLSALSSSLTSAFPSPLVGRDMGRGLNLNLNLSPLSLYTSR